FLYSVTFYIFFFFFQAEDGIRDGHVTGVQTCALPISALRARAHGRGQDAVLQGPRLRDVQLHGDERPGGGLRGDAGQPGNSRHRSEEHTSELQSRGHLVCRLLLEKKNTLSLPRVMSYY